MNFSRKRMNQGGKVLALMGFGFILVGLFGTSYCITEPNFSIRACTSLMKINPSGGWQGWIFTNRDALLILAPVMGCLMAYFSEDRFGMFIGGLCVASVTLLKFANNAISANEIDMVSLQWAWYAVIGGTACLILSAFPADPPFVADEHDVVSAVGDSEKSSINAPPSVDAETRSTLSLASAAAIIGVLMLAFGATFAPTLCNDRLDQECDDSRTYSYFDRQVFDGDFSAGLARNEASFSMLLMGMLALVATRFKRSLAVSLVGWSSLLYIVILFMHPWAILSTLDQNILDYVRWGWIGLFGGPLLIIIASDLFKRADDLKLLSSNPPATTP